ncbi:hypothetical protein, partial [Thermodesulfatator indicus]
MGKKFLMVLVAFLLMASGAYAVDIKFSGSMLNLVGASNNITGIDSGDYSDANKEGDIFGATRVRPT